MLKCSYVVWLIVGISYLLVVFVVYLVTCCYCLLDI